MAVTVTAVLRRPAGRKREAGSRRVLPGYG